MHLRPFAAGDTFERYTIEALIGRGGMGEVYRAIDTRLRRKVALKVIRPDKERPDAAARLYREARAAAALTHPNAVAVHDVGEAEGVFYIVMELVVGQPLLAFVGDPRATAPKKVAWLTDVARALGAAHRAGIIHRDVKPSNVMVSEEGFAKVLDFGLARPLGPIDPVSFRTQEGRVLGTLRYMAPEQVVGAEADARSDQYAFGLTAYELLAGEHPGGALIDTRPKRIDEIAPGVHPELALVIERTLARDPDKRFPAMDDVVTALESSVMTQRAPPPYMTPSPLVVAPPASPDSTAETMTAQKFEIPMMPSDSAPPPGEIGRTPTLAALAKAGARDQELDAKPHNPNDATLISKEAPSALLREREAAAVLGAKTLPLAAAPPRPVVVAATPASNPPPSPNANAIGSTPPPRAPTPPVVIPSAPPPRIASQPAPPASSNQRTTIIVSVAVLACAAFAGTYLGSIRSSAPPPTNTASSAAAPSVTFTASPKTEATPSASAAMPLERGAPIASVPPLEAPKPTVAPPATTMAPKAKPASTGVNTR